MIDKEKRNARQRKWNTKNRDKVKATRKRYAERHPERFREIRRKSVENWKRANPDRVRELQRRWARANPEKVARTTKMLRDRKRLILEASIGRQKPDCCEICSMPKILTADHCHVSGIYRGWICRNCNLAIGNAFDKPDLLRKMASYLEGKLNLNKEKISI